MGEQAKPDFNALRAERDLAIEKLVREVWLDMGGDPNEVPTFHCRDHGADCYCACPDGPCEHEFSGWREILDDDEQPCGGEQFCQRCGMGAMSHDMRVCP